MSVAVRGNVKRARYGEHCDHDHVVARSFREACEVVVVKGASRLSSLSNNVVCVPNSKVVTPSLPAFRSFVF